MNSYYGISYRGYRFYSEWEEEVDRCNKKLWHYIVDPNGKETIASIGGSYDFPNVTEVHQYIDSLIGDAS